MGAAHVAAIESDRQAELGAVVTTNPKAREGDLSETGGNLEIGTRHFDFSNVSKYSTWQELISDKSISAVTICLPTDLHCQVTMAALAAGKHVLCEKPMALTTGECDRMLEAAKKAGRTLMIGQVLRFWPDYVKLRDFANKGEYGTVRQATFTRKCGIPDWSKWLPDESRSGGAVMDLLIHDIDQILGLFGVPARVTAKRLGSTDSIMASFIYTKGPEVRLQGGWFEAGMPFSMGFQVRADRGEIELSADGLHISDMNGIKQKVELPATNAHTEEMRYFIDCCHQGVSPADCPPEASAAAVRVALALRESRAKDGEQITCLA